MLSTVVPTLLGPLIVALLYASVTVATGPLEGLLGGFLTNWLVVMAITGSAALALSACMLGLDLLWLWAGQRALGSTKAWIAALLAPVPVGVAWALWRPQGLAAFLLPVVAAAVVARVVAWLTDLV